ncbi:hypothetical protein AQS8620_02424 [Aquimixticola soesokkakensis]|uniref:Uncharacterized protein n=1 Tax=Aquimixticola soesokkakensis TaxID=1519096 RepID=A0A1Y5T4J7_9RHOB|nr:hypothetical protein [Aquimixticola soesokkakensis]SLN55226.1 hypothetical protein AQS8620_02424 [Aquimixticola soesokkakensis]
MTKLKNILGATLAGLAALAALGAGILFVATAVVIGAMLALAARITFAARPAAAPEAPAPCEEAAA